jgi:hypothetical protein
MRPGRVVVLLVFGQHSSQVLFIDDQQPVQEFTAQGTDDLSQIAFALGACGGLARILIPSAVNTSSKELVNWPARSLIRNLTEAALAEVHQDVPGCLRCPGAVRVRGDAGQVYPAGAVLNDDQGIEAPQEHGIHVDEVGSEDATGFRRQELLPRRAGAPRCGADPGVMQVCHTVDAEIRWPSLTSSPCTRRCPQPGLSVAMRNTSVRIAAAVDGRPGLRRWL